MRAFINARLTFEKHKQIVYKRSSWNSNVQNEIKNNIDIQL